MGKMGAFELNYSSDIDLIVFYDPEARALADKDDAAAFHVRITRGLVKLLQERTADGYVFRVDLRLRPDPASTQIAVSTEAALNYYGSVGQNWERAAMIKARACAGDIKAGEDILRQLSPFIWRKYLDYAAVADIEALKRQIHAYRGHADIAVEGHNIKLGRGGIREIEFFVQTQQLVAGGRHPELRGRETLPTLAALVEGGWIGADARADLEAAYLFLRETEHRLQMVADDQTHTLPPDPRGAGAVRALCRLQGPRRTLPRRCSAICARCSAITSGCSRETTARPSRLALSFPKDADDRETLNRLGAMGFQRPLETRRRSATGCPASYQVLRGEFGRRNSPILCRCCSIAWPAPKIPSRGRGVRRLHGRHHRGARLFSLLRQNPDLVTLVALTLGTAPRLADILARHPEAMDALLEPSFFGALPDEAALRPI